MHFSSNSNRIAKSAILTCSILPMVYPAREPVDHVPEVDHVQHHSQIYGSANQALVSLTAPVVLGEEYWFEGMMLPVPKMAFTPPAVYCEEELPFPSA